MGFYPVAVIPQHTNTRITQNNTPHSKHSTQSCTNNKGHILSLSESETVEEVSEQSTEKNV
jgi:hypothetical protein